MRLNKYIAHATGLSRRTADDLIARGLVMVNGQPPEQGMQVSDSDHIEIEGTRIQPSKPATVLLNKPTGYVCSRNGQGSKTIYDLLPAHLHSLKPVGRLDKNSSGLLLLTNNGDLAYALTHPSQRKTKVYEITLDAPLAPLHRQMISDFGVQLEDGPSRLQLERMREENDTAWRVTMHEGRNRQIRRTFQALDYTVVTLHRTQFGAYTLGRLPIGSFEQQS